MREDMKHVIIDRPRRGGEGGKSRPPKGTVRLWQRMPAEEYPKRETMAPGRRYSSDCKYLNEHLAPLRRWLQSKCGQPWDKVYSEICAGLSVRNATSAHVRDHAEKYVVQTTILVGGVVCDSVGNPIDSRRQWHFFFVDPRDRTLRAIKRWKRRRSKAAEQQYIHGKDEMHRYVAVDRIWYEVELAWLPQTEKISVRDVLTGETLRNYPGEGPYYGNILYARGKRQLGKQQIRRLRLRETRLKKES